MTQELIIYSTPHCVPCEGLKKILRAEGLEFEVKDILVDGEAAQVLEQRDIRSVPVLSIDGELHHGEALRMENLVGLLDFT